jgi:hypothetical protein
MPCFASITIENQGFQQLSMRDFTFLVCSERSGSNFISSLMNGHSKICGPPPTHLFRMFGTNMDRYGDLREDKNWSQLLYDFVESFQHILGHWNTGVSQEELLLNVEKRTAGALLRYLYEKEAKNDLSEHIFVKENRTYLFAPFLLSQFSGCKFLVSVRDPRDMALSWARTDTIPGGVKKAVDTWLEDQLGALNLFGQLSGTGRCLVIRYEDLLRETEECLSTVLAWLGLDYEEEMLAFNYDERTKRNSRRIAAWNNLEKGILRDNYSKFRGQLSDDEIRYIELRCGQLMEVFGYETLTAHVNTKEGYDRQEEINKLESMLEDGVYHIPPIESEIRKKRLATIARILERKQQCQIATRKENT